MNSVTRYSSRAGGIISSLSDIPTHVSFMKRRQKSLDKTQKLKNPAVNFRGDTQAPPKPNVAKMFHPWRRGGAVA